MGRVVGMFLIVIKCNSLVRSLGRDVLRFLRPVSVPMVTREHVSNLLDAGMVLYLCYFASETVWRWAVASAQGYAVAGLVAWE